MEVVAVSDRPTVAIWKSMLLPGSETFVRNQADALIGYDPAFLGAVKVQSAVAADTDTIAYSSLPRDQVRFRLFRLTGRSRRVTNLLAAMKPALVHAHFGPEGWLISGAAASIGVPLVVTLHGHDVTAAPSTPGLRGARARWQLRQAFDRAAVVIAVSDFIRQRAIDLGADPQKVLVHYIGVPIPPKQPPTPKEWDVVFVGRFTEKKGIEDLIEALAMVGTARRPRCVFIGAGPLDQQVRDRAVRLGVDATFAGMQPPDAVKRYMAASKMLAAPSRTAPNGDSEGLGMTLLESAALSVPSVATRHGGIPDAVVHGETGLLSDEGDVAALAGNIRRLLDDDALRVRLGDQARQRVELRFDITKQSAALEDIYDMAARRSHVSTGPAREATWD
ncbi:glycosyltransferase [Micromonospora thermarum]|uniref:Glycosyltransferase n=1 Tax=Micromonospora thermarum TaxID=2720024 RepID=A0ABX0YZ93_9ACTN|nr:glycosyltransferase [Micromonospora thermarum]NJP30807.1 glycosyltransferase [Micromonospora thermarum]